MLTVFGTPIGGRIVIGKACVVDAGMIDVPRYRITEDLVGPEQARIRLATQAVAQELELVAAQLPTDAPAEAKALLEVHQMILTDPSLIEAAEEKVAYDLVNAEWAIADRADELAEQFLEIEDEYLRERGRDVEQVSARILKALAGSRLAVTRRGPNESLIFVADDIAPADMLQLRDALGFVIEHGGTNSHTAILARGMGVASVVGVHDASHLIRDGDTLVLDGFAGAIIVDPVEAVLREYEHRQRLAQLESQKLMRLVDVRCETLDGREIALMANIEDPDEAEAALAVGASGIGLFRSEFLFLNKPVLPSEDEQFEAYAAVVRAMQDRPVTIRTIDVGADKSLPGQEYLHSGLSALGQRAIRYSLSEPEVFLTQLRAILRASALGKVRILLPMLSHVQQIDAAQVLIRRAREQVQATGRRMAAEVPVGGMIEVPAAAVSANIFAARLDFLSIGTNDLVQYTLAIDRTDATVAHLYDEFHPSVIRLVALSIRAARKAGKPVSVCGEMAGEVGATGLLLGMGLSEFSMHSTSLLRVKRAVLGSDSARLESRVRRLLTIEDPVRQRMAIDRLGDPTPISTLEH